MLPKKIDNALLLIFIVCLMGCDWGWDIDKSSRNQDRGVLPSQTQILNIDIDPNPVIAGGDITFTCIIKDSLSSIFSYQWSVNLANQESFEATSGLNKVTMKSPEIPGTYKGYIAVYYDLQARNSQPAFEEFQYEVTDNAE